jgi:hypothetical protein
MLTVGIVVRFFIGRDDDAVGISNDEAVIVAENELMAKLRDSLVLHRMPPVVLGSGRGQTIHKFCAIMHSFFLETGTAARLQRFCGEVHTVTSDLGVEFSLTAVQPVPVTSLLPWVLAIDPAQDFGGPFELDELPEVSEDVHLNDGMAVPGLMHIIHNASNSLLSVMDALPDAIDKLAKVADLIRHPESCKRLCATCFSDPVGLLYHQALREFDGHVYKDRWCTVAHCTHQILRIKFVLRFGWNKQKYVEGQAGQDRAADTIDIVDEAIRSDFWWAAIFTADALMKAVRGSLVWAESCPCHHHLLRLGAAPGLLRAWLVCPLRGRRLPEVAAGDFGSFVAGLLDCSLARLLLELPGTLTDAQRGALAQDFASGRTHLSFQMALKLHAMSEPPRLLYAAAHHNSLKSRDAVRRCLAHRPNHPLMAQLHAEPMKTQAVSYLEGIPLDDLPEFAAFLGSFSFGFAVERMVEGDHAAVHRGYGKARFHGESYDSLVRRLPEIKRQFRSSQYYRLGS